MGTRIGTAPDSWGVWFPSHEAQTPWRRFLDEVVEAGYDAIELGPFGYLPTDPGVLASELSARGLRLASAFVFGDLAAPGAWLAFRDEVARLCEILTRHGADRLVLIPSLYTDLFTGTRVAPPTLDEDGWRRLGETCDEIGRFSSQAGIVSVFHPHAESVVEYADQAEKLLAVTDARYVGLCLDTGHHAYRGGDAVAFARDHADRLAHVHLKSVDRDIAREVTAAGTSFAEAVRRGVFCELDRGAVDVPILMATLADVGYDGWAIVEQDMFPTPFDRPLPIARHNREYLLSIGAG